MLRLALCVSGQARDLPTYIVHWHALVQENIVKAASARAHADFFLLLSDLDTDSASFEHLRQHLRPVLAIASRTSDCSSPLLEPLCRNLSEREQDQRYSPGIRARVQYYWIASCFEHVELYERISLTKYDYVIRLRPDVHVLEPMPAIGSLDTDAVYYTMKNHQAWDTFYLVPRRHLRSFATALTLLLDPPHTTSSSTGAAKAAVAAAAVAAAPPMITVSAQAALSNFTWHICCPESYFVHYVSVLGLFPMRALALPMAVQRRCFLECLYFPRRHPNGTWHEHYPLRPKASGQAYDPRTHLSGNEQLTVIPTVWEESCNLAAARAGSFPTSHRAVKLLDLYNGRLAKIARSSSAGPDQCAEELRRLCGSASLLKRRQVGWEQCERSPGRGIIAGGAGAGGAPGSAAAALPTTGAAAREHIERASRRAAPAHSQSRAAGMRVTSSVSAERATAESPRSARPQTDQQTSAQQTLQQTASRRAVPSSQPSAAWTSGGGLGAVLTRVKLKARGKLAP